MSTTWPATRPSLPTALPTWAQRQEKAGWHAIELRPGCTQRCRLHAGQQVCMRRQLPAPAAPRQPSGSPTAPAPPASRQCTHDARPAVEGPNHRLHSDCPRGSLWPSAQQPTQPETTPNQSRWIIICLPHLHDDLQHARRVHPLGLPRNVLKAEGEQGVARQDGNLLAIHLVTGGLAATAQAQWGAAGTIRSVCKAGRDGNLLAHVAGGLAAAAKEWPDEAVSRRGRHKLRRPLSQEGRRWPTQRGHVAARG